MQQTNDNRQRDCRRPACVCITEVQVSFSVLNHHATLTMDHSAVYMQFAGTQAPRSCMPARADMFQLAGIVSPTKHLVQMTNPVPSPMSTALLCSALRHTCISYSACATGPPCASRCGACQPYVVSLPHDPAFQRIIGRRLCSWLEDGHSNATRGTAGVFMQNNRS